MSKFRGIVKMCLNSLKLFKENSRLFSGHGDESRPSDRRLVVCCSLVGFGFNRRRLEVLQATCISSNAMNLSVYSESLSSMI